MYCRAVTSGRGASAPPPHSSFWPNSQPYLNQGADYDHHRQLLLCRSINIFFSLSTGSFKGSLTNNNYENFVGMMASEVTLQIEKASCKSKFSRLGGLQFDREIRSLVSFFAAWSMREKFSRLNQIATILNLEAVSEINDFHENWKLTTTEMKQTLALRVDFNAEEVKKLRL